MHWSHCFTYRKYRGYRYSSVSGRAAPPKAKGPSVCGRHFEESELLLCEKAGIAHNSKTASVAFIRQSYGSTFAFGNHVIAVVTSRLRVLTLDRNSGRFSVSVIALQQPR